MSNPTIASGNVTRRADSLLSQFRLVKETSGKEGYVEHSDADTFPFGAVTESAAPAPTPQANNLSHGLPELIRVHAAQCIVKLATDETSLTVGAKVYAAADGKVAAAGTVAVGLVDKAVAGGLVRVHLFHPAALA